MLKKGLMKKKVLQIIHLPFRPPHIDACLFLLTGLVMDSMN